MTRGSVGNTSRNLIKNFEDELSSFLPKMLLYHACILALLLSLSGVHAQYDYYDYNDDDYDYDPDDYGGNDPDEGWTTPDPMDGLDHAIQIEPTFTFQYFAIWILLTDEALKEPLLEYDTYRDQMLGWVDATNNVGFEGFDRTVCYPLFSSAQNKNKRTGPEW